ncbi:MAG: hypothetical protein P1P64_08650 [Treponemataceae bacterium]
MKKFFIGIFALLFASQILVAQNRDGLNKIGGYVGWPIGLSYSHNFTKVDQIDLVASFAIPYTHSFGFRADVGYLRSVFEPVVGGVECPLEVGGGVGIIPIWYNTRYVDSYGNVISKPAFVLGMNIFADLRWEVFFSNVPNFNLFLDFAPGVGLSFHKHATIADFSYRAGVGLRYAF